MLRNGLEPWHLLIVAVVFIVLFGSRKLPDTARALGKSMRILKSEAKAMKDDTGAPGAAGAPVVEPSQVMPASDVRASTAERTAAEAPRPTDAPASAG
ncbi:Sec-independent protein translocase subunit TatA [Streptomyces sp. NPDC059680]|uniref:Sec-independent protein translocase subunit TatA n=1 Tax=Streptomyces TaxID=1883 RepID=UPI001E40B5E9|nr:Sec-independent protein translocase subunit TatA [Streptomyces barringtoniae]MCC5473760.1 Sec-independent protein translocase subunit TatA [Streptomyces barringtoniae]